MKSIAFKVADSELERLNYYKDTPEGGETIISKFVKAAILEKCERIRHLRTGGFILEFPNPDNFHISEEDKAKIIRVLTKANAELAGIDPALGSYLSEMVAYLQWNFYTMTVKQRKTFEDNFIKDLEFDATLDEMEDAEFDAIQERASKAFKE